jgi:Bifunctional DNA primase/polymerase, N-terminal
MTQSYRPNRTQAKRPRPLGYADVYEDYRAADWTPVPLPRSEKQPPPKGYTGRDHREPVKHDYLRWASEFPDGNVMLVMPRGVIAIDVDAYHGGCKTMKGLYSKYGPLPVTATCTSRDDGSGHSFYQVPPGTELVSKINGGIEFIQYHHRYSVVWPSLNPDNKMAMYEWWMLDEPADIPLVSELPDLPDTWVAGLTARSSKSVGKPHTEGRPYDGKPFDGDTGEWLEEHAGRVPLRTKAKIRPVLRLAERRFRTEGGRYDTMVSSTGRLVHLGAEGANVADALDDLCEIYCDEVGPDRESDRVAVDEFWRSVSGAIAKFGGKS